MAIVFIIGNKEGVYNMSLSIENYIKLARFYNQIATAMSAICVQKGGIPLENYVGRFFVADVLEYIVEYGRRIKEENKKNVIPPEIEKLMHVFEQRYEAVKDLVTPSQKPIYEMTLEEFEKMMNIV